MSRSCPGGLSKFGICHCGQRDHRRGRSGEMAVATCCGRRGCVARARRWTPTSGSSSRRHTSPSTTVASARTRSAGFGGQRWAVDFERFATVHACRHRCCHCACRCSLHFLDGLACPLLRCPRANRSDPPDPIVDREGLVRHACVWTSSTRRVGVCVAVAMRRRMMGHSLPEMERHNHMHRQRVPTGGNQTIGDVEHSGRQRIG